MEHDPRAWLEDILEACDAIEQFIENLDCDAYSANALVQAAVELSARSSRSAISWHTDTM
jgi:uncharacterized protein with HEPN domain